MTGENVIKLLVICQACLEIDGVKTERLRVYFNSSIENYKCFCCKKHTTCFINVKPAPHFYVKIYHKIKSLWFYASSFGKCIHCGRWHWGAHRFFQSKYWRRCNVKGGWWYQ